MDAAANDAAAQANARDIHADLMSRDTRAVAGGERASAGGPRFQTCILGTDASTTKIPALWTTSNPWKTTGATSGFNTTLILENDSRGAATQAAATSAKLGQVQIGYLPASPAGPGVIFTAVYLQNTVLDASGTPTHVYLKASNLPELSASRDAAVQAHLTDINTAMADAYQQALNAGIPINAGGDLFAVMTTAVAPFSVPLAPQVLTTQNPWATLDGPFPYLAFGSSVLDLPNGNPTTVMATATASTLGQVQMGFVPPNPSTGSPAILATAVWLWKPIIDPILGQTHVFMKTTTVSLDGSSKDAAARTNATEIHAVMTAAYTKALAAGIPMSTAADLLSVMTTTVAPLPGPLAPQVLSARNPWANYGTVSLAYAQGIQSVPNPLDLATAAGMASSGTLGQTQMGFAPPDPITGAPATFATAVWLATPFQDPILGSTNVFVKITTLDNQAKDDAARANAASIHDQIVEAYYKTQAAGIPVLSSADLWASMTTPIAPLTYPLCPQVLTGTNPWAGVAAAPASAYSQTLQAMATADLAGALSLTHPGLLGQVQYGFLPGDPAQGMPPALATAVWLSTPFLDPTVGMTNTYVKVTRLDANVGPNDLAARTNATSIHETILAEFLKAKAAGTPVDQFIEFQTNLIGTSVLDSKIPALWLTTNPWNTLGYRAGYNTTLINEFNPDGTATSFMATPASLGQVQMGFLPATPSTPALFITAVYLQNGFLDANGFPTHVLIKVTNLE